MKFLVIFLLAALFGARCGCVLVKDEFARKEVISFSNHKLNPVHRKSESNAYFAVDDIHGVGRVFDGIGALSAGEVISHSSLEINPVHSKGESEASFSIDDIHGVGRVFDGIGAISGGGATSKLLISYEEPHRSNILDFLYKPGFGASLQIQKVEIGGDSQSTDGSESSHMHTAADQNYNRGYEWWLMKEAKKRNPAIKFYGLPWTFPGWIGSGVFDPFKNSTATAYYIINWIKGASEHHNLTIDYIGVWNERNCDPTYVKLLRRLLNENGLSHVKIVVPDSMDWSIVDQLIKDKDYLDAMDIIGQHYPGAFSPDAARSLGKALWGSEEFSDGNSLSGGGCWARVLNESPVNAQLTAFIAWNLIASYYEGFPYSEFGLMTANEPWSGHYVVSSPIWATAHHTHFYSPGWSYLLPYHGLGNLTGNGTYIAVTSPDRKELTIVIETVDPHNAGCFYPMPTFTVADEQAVTLMLDGSYKNIQNFNVWYSYFDFTGSDKTVLFQKLPQITVVNQTIQLKLKKNEVYTLSTLPGGQKGAYGDPPVSKPFPSNYTDDFESYPIGNEPALLSQQSGSFEVTQSGDATHGKVVTQVVTQPPVDTCLPTTFRRPANVFGDYRWKNVFVSMDIFLNKKSPEVAGGVYLGSQMAAGGCDVIGAKGIYFWISVETGVYRLTSGQDSTCDVFAEGVLLTLEYGQWFNLALDVQNKSVIAYLNHQAILTVELESLPSQHGFVVFGPDSFGVAHFDNLVVSRAEIAGEAEWREDRERQREKDRLRKLSRKSDGNGIFSMP